MVDKSQKIYLYLQPFFHYLSLLILGFFLSQKNLVWAGRIETSIGLKEEYTDNLYLEKENIKDDYMTTLEAGLKLPSTSERRGFEGEYVGNSSIIINTPGKTG